MKRTICIFLCLVFSLTAFEKERFLDQLEESIHQSFPEEDFSLCIEQLRKKQTFSLHANDSAARPLFVFLQAEFEKAFAKLLTEKEIKHVLGVIHTPAPATPLCTKGDITKDLVSPKLLQDDKRLKTVTLRAHILREYLKAGGILYSAFSKNGLELRTQDQREVFLKTLSTYPDHLFSVELNTSSGEFSYSGATYLFQDLHGHFYFFSLSAPQALFPEDERKWEIWFGELVDEKLLDRFEEIAVFLKRFSGPDLFQYLERD